MAAAQGESRRQVAYQQRRRERGERRITIWLEQDLVDWIDRYVGEPFGIDGKGTPENRSDVIRQFFRAYQRHGGVGW